MRRAPKRRSENAPDEAKARQASTLATNLVGELRSEIIRGALPPGQKLLVEAVCARYGVGASPVREALSRLSAEGLVVRREQRGFFVAEATIEDLIGLINTRRWLEDRAIRESIAHRTQEWEDAIVLAHHHLTKVSRWLPLDSSGSYRTNPVWENRHREFHRALISACGAKPLLRFCAELSDQLERYRQLAAEAIYPFKDEAREHKTIMELAVDGKADEAADALAAHYQNTLRVIRSSPFLTKSEKSSIRL